MKKLFIVLAVMSFSICIFGQITASAHDFQSETWNSTGEICIVCHTPHNADPYATGITGAPLWNHDVTSQIFTTYGTTILGTLADATPATMSLLCLSCHDGVTAVDSFGGAAGTTPLTGGSNLGIDLSDDHPVSIAYIPANDLRVTTTALTGAGQTGTIADLLYAGNVECSSCHDVHNAYGQSSLLRLTNAASNLCLNCHDK